MFLVCRMWKNHASSLYSMEHVTQKLDPEKSGPRSTFSPAKTGPKVDWVQFLQTKSGPGPVFVNQK